jgi:D-glucosaminate-6-phosphate ammonia-lyase
MTANPYRALGVRPFINCCGVRTMHGGSLMLPQVRAAIDAASRQFVNLDELMEAAGRRIAELTGAEWGIVTCGSAAAVALGTAACVAGNDPVKMVRLPFTDGMVNRAIIPAKQRFAYDQAVRMVGCRIVEIDTRAELDRALEEPVALVVLLGKQEHLSAVRLEEIAAVCKPRGIPILVDAASEHIERPSPWLRRGADLVVYSGGKFLRGPQTSGLLLGDKGLCQAAWRNGSPHQALGRPMKVSKEDIVGVVAALEYWFGERDEAAERRKWDADLATIAERLAVLDGVRSEVLAPSGVDKVPRLKVIWDRTRFPLDGLGLRQAVLDGEPRVMLDDNSATDDSLAIDPFQLQPGEAVQVGDAIVNALRAALTNRAPAVRAPGPDVAGEWELRVDFMHGTRAHRLMLEQNGGDIGGRQRSALFEGPVCGDIDGEHIRLAFEGRHEAATISYRFEGSVTDGEMAGTVLLGAASDQNQGIVNRTQFGAGAWLARRLAG